LGFGAGNGSYAHLFLSVFRVIFPLRSFRFPFFYFILFFLFFFVCFVLLRLLHLAAASLGGCFNVVDF